MENYDGSKDPLDHLEFFKTLMHLQRVPDEIMCRAFPTMLKGSARIWFSRMTPNSIGTFKELSAQFASHFIERHRYKKSIACLMNIKQWEDETLRSYIAHFNKEALSIGEADDKILMTAFTNGLRKGKFLFSLYKNDLKTMSDLLYRVTKYINAEDALLAREKSRGKGKNKTYGRIGGRRCLGQENGGRIGVPSPPTIKFTSFIPLIASIDQVLMQIKDEGVLIFPGKLKGDPNKRSRDKYCRFHRDHSHDTSDCYKLKQQIEALIRQGKLQRFISKERMDPPQEQAPRRENKRPKPPIGDIRMIVGGTTAMGSSKKACKTYLKMV